MIARACITLFTTASGGRSSPIKTGYVALVGIGGVLGSASVKLLRGDFVEPGETQDIELFFADTSPLAVSVRAGQPITLNEGLRVIGEGTITVIL